MTETPAAPRRHHIGLRALPALPGRPALGASTLAVGALTVLLATSSVAAAQPGAAAEPGEVVELSTDATSYSRSLSDLFGPVRLTPGDQVDDSFWVRNSGAQPARLTLSVTEVDVSDADTLRALTLTAGPAARPGGAVPLADVAQYATLSAGETLDPGEAIMISSTLALGDLSGRQGQESTIDLTVRVTLSGAATDAAARDTAATDSATDTATRSGPLAPTDSGPLASTDSGPLASTDSGPLASTDSGLLAWTGGVAASSAVTAGALVVFGLVLWCAARRRQDRDSGPDGPATSGPAARGDCS